MAEFTSENYFPSELDPRTFEQMLFDMQEKTDAVLASYIKEGYLVTFARLLLYMSPDKANKVLTELDQDTRQKLTFLMNRERGNTKSIEFEAKTAFAVSNFSGFQELTALEQKRREQVEIDMAAFNAFVEHNPIFGNTLRNMHFPFTELIMLDDRAIQKVLREADSQELATALCGCDQEVQNKIFRNISVRAAEELRTQISIREKNVNLRLIENAQEKICSIILRLEESGDIVFPYGRISQSEIDELLGGAEL